MKTPFTKGPWETINNGGYTDIVSTVNATRKISLMADLDDDMDVVELDANANLIALSPDMANAIYRLLMARKQSTEAFRAESYSSETQAVFDAVENMFKE